MIIKIKKEIYVRGEQGNLYTARFRIREKKAKTSYGTIKTHRYLYLSYRDGKKIKEIYVAKLEDGPQNG